MCDHLRKALNVVCAGLHSRQKAWKLNIQQTPAQYVRCQKHHQRWSNASKVDCVCQSTVMKQETTSGVIFCEQLQPQSVDASYVHGQYIFAWVQYLEHLIHGSVFIETLIEDLLCIRKAQSKNCCSLHRAAMSTLSINCDIQYAPYIAILCKFWPRSWPRKDSCDPWAWVACRSTLDNYNTYIPGSLVWTYSLQVKSDGRNRVAVLCTRSLQVFEVISGSIHFNMEELLRSASWHVSHICRHWNRSCSTHPNTQHSAH